jgi:hypothetical protein
MVALTMAQAASPTIATRPNAVVIRLQWRVFSRGPGATLPAADHGFSVRVRGGQCRGAEHLIIPELDEAADRGASLTARLRSRLAALRHLGAMALGVLRVGLDLMTAPAAPDDQPMPVAELTQLLRRL